MTAINKTNSRFLSDLRIIIILWPIWWLLGIDQLFFPFFIIWEFFFHIAIKFRFQFQINRTIRWSALLLVWWLTSIFWVPSGLLTVYLKEFATISTQFMILILLWNSIKSQSDWDKLIEVLMIIAFYTVIGAFIFILGIWRGQISSAMGILLPKSLIDSSSFFNSVAIRSFGAFSSEFDGKLSYRVSGFFSSYSSLSLSILAIFPYLWWKIYRANWKTKVFYGTLMMGAMTSLIFTESRVAYGAFVIEFGLLIIWSIVISFRKNDRLLIGFTIAFLGCIFVVLLLPLIPNLVEKIQWTATQWRPGSFTVRNIIYTETFRLLPEHIITGWGTPIRILGMPSNFSAGSHSSFLAMLFQHGIVGFLLYLFLLLSIWMSLFFSIRQARKLNVSYAYKLSSFATVSIIMLFSFHLREALDIWWWDTMLSIIIWIIWGTILTAPRVLLQG